MRRREKRTLIGSLIALAIFAALLVRPPEEAKVLHEGIVISKYGEPESCITACHKD